MTVVNGPAMHSLSLTKPDGRALTLYSRRPLDPGIVAPSPFAEPLHASPHLRWHPLRGEWVTYAAHRQDRTFLPPASDAADPWEVWIGTELSVMIRHGRHPQIQRLLTNMLRLRKASVTTSAGASVC